jgi:hypothetical protein
MDINQLTGEVIGAAIEVHKVLGPGLLESAYEECLFYELTLKKLQCERQKPLPVEYKGVKLDCGYRLDLVVDKRHRSLGEKTSSRRDSGFIQSPSPDWIKKEPLCELRVSVVKEINSAYERSNYQSD